MEIPTEFSFPFQPYEIQKDFMKELYTSLETGKLGIFESPTGTGKSLSLCCGALQWLKDHEAYEQKQLLDQIENLKISVQSSNTDDVDWLSDEYNKIQTNTKINELKLKLDLIIKNRQKIDDLKSRKIKERELKGKPKWLTDKNKKEKKENISENISLQEEDGVISKEALLDDLDIILDEEIQENDTEDLEETAEISSENEGVKIFFCSRTHSQLSQFVNEIKRTSHSSDVRVVSLASRQQYCINPSVQKLKNSHLINERCLDLQKGKKGKVTSKSEDGKVTKRSKCGSGCAFYNQANIESLRDEALIEIKDVEELVMTAKTLNSCPYYSSRAAIKDAQVVVVPYQTLLHEPTRRANGINLKNNIVIIDEAHNLLDTIGHIHTAEVSGRQLKVGLDKLMQYKEKYCSRFGAKNLLFLNQFIFIVGKILGVLKKPSKDGGTNKILTLEEFVLGAEIDNYNLRPLLNFCVQSKITQKLHGFSERHVPDTTDDKKPPATKSCGVESFLSKITEEVSKSKQKNKNVDLPVLEITPTPEKQISVGNVIQRVLGFLETLTSKYIDGRILTSHSASIEDGSHKFILLNPAAQFTDIIKEARAIIVAGGTMQPFSEFRDQLFLSAGATEERIKEFSCGHVIPPENILPICLTEGPSGKKINFSYEMRNTKEMLTEFGRILQNICNIVPGGIVCFFPSYDYEKTVFNHLKSNGVMEKIGNKKKVFREPKTTAQVDQVLEEYSKTIKRCKNTTLTGALMLSVIGGKLSEGLNFSDDLGRCVMVVGMPYPNIKSIELQEKIKYLNENVSATAGNQHYENLCFKAVNQCIGRAVRHAQDYATVLLLDERYSRDQATKSLPKWIQRSLMSSVKFGTMVGSVSRFFSNHKLK